MSVPLWQEEPCTPRPPARRPVRGDVVIVGGGIGGIATAWQLLERGLRPTVVEAREVGSGATGRNGGFFIAGAAPMYHETRRRWGAARARRIHAATLAAQEAMLAVAGEVGAAGHFRRVGMLRVAVDADEAADVRAHQAALAQDGFPGELTGDLPVPGELGLFFPGDGAVHPVRWLRALAAACEARGARIFERTPVALGEIRADRIVVAADAGIAALAPSVRARRLHMVATEPAPPRLPFPVYARHGHEYAQQLPDGRIAVGGFSDLDGEASWTDREEVSAPVVERLGAYLRDFVGVGAAITHRWVGIVGYSDAALPVCGEVAGRPGVFALGGYNGTGHVQAWVAARIVAELIESGASPDGDLYAPAGPLTPPSGPARSSGR